MDTEQLQARIVRTATDANLIRGIIYGFSAGPWYGLACKGDYTEIADIYPDPLYPVTGMSGNCWFDFADEAEEAVRLWFIE